MNLEELNNKLKEILDKFEDFDKRLKKLEEFHEGLYTYIDIKESET